MNIFFAYEKLDKKTTRWLYQQERGFVEGMRDVSLIPYLPFQRKHFFDFCFKKF